MIITKILGGLGNQMFRYAVGRRAAWKNNTQLKLDITGYENQAGMTQRKFLLGIFTIQHNIATRAEIKKFVRVDSSIMGRAHRWLPMLTVHHQPFHYLAERHFHFDPEILNVPDNTYLDGDWQSEKYFSDIADLIRKDFTFKNKPDAANQAMLNEIAASTAVSVHVRRGDYLTKPAADLLGTCPLEYYSRAVKLMQQKLPHPKFFVFSDDIAWAEESLKFSTSACFVNRNQQGQDFEDLRLMNHCHHYIIANSSFSWWGAWLSQHHDKIVIAPQQWFRDPLMNTRDLLPDSWIRL